MPEIKPVPSLIIGIGGTGVITATYVKKDLLEITGTNELPRGVQILAFDTETQNRIRVGGYGRPRRAGGPQTGAVELEAGQYIYIGGDVSQDAREVANGQHAYLGRWWNARDYLQEQLPADLWNLNKGAGQYRQFGRMALFKNFSIVQRMINSALQSIRNGVPGATELYVHITGSFVGGTGAGLFADMAYLTSILAKQAGFSQPSVRGYFVLVDAFQGTPPVGLDDARKKRTYNAQCYATLRECGRLISATDWATGYPMPYADYGDAELLRGKMTKRPYDAVYLFDGVRLNNPLTQYRIEEGIAPTIADAIVAHVDAKSGLAFTAHTVNSDKQRVSLRIPNGVPTYGTLGTFTIVFPIFHIVEEWTHRLAQEVLDELLTPRTWDQDTGIVTALASNKRGGLSAPPSGDGAERGREWLQKQAPTGLIRDLGEKGAKYSLPGRQSEVEAEFKGRSIETWIKLLKPEDVMAAMTADAIERATLVLESDLTKEKVKRGGVVEPNEYYVPPNPGGSDRDQAEQVANETRRMFRILVGEEDEETGRRTGGRVKDALDALKAIHITKFRTALRTFLEETLNGSAGADALEAKAGKLGFMLAYLTQIRDDLRQARSALEKTEGAQREGMKKQSASRRRESDTVLRDAEEKMRKSGGLLGANRKAYLAAAQQYLQTLKNEIAERVAWETVEELIQVAESALEETTNWAEALGFRNAKAGGLYALVLEGRRHNASDREQSAKVRVREQISDPQYENEKYQDYVSRGGPPGERTQLKKILGEFAWGVHVDANTGRLRLALRCGEKELSVNKVEHIGRANVRLFLDRCRSVFDAAWDDLSVLKYLMSKYGPQQEKTIEDLAQLIKQKSDLLLSVRGQPPLPANFLRAHFESVAELSTSAQDEEKKQRDFLAELTERLATLTNTQVLRSSSEEGAQAKFADFTDSMDRFKLSFVYFSELNQPKDINAFSSAVSDYRSYTGKRTHLHIFPAEQHAVHYEAQLGKMSPPQRPRELDDHVVVQLEDLDRFKFIVRCLVYGDPNYEWTQGGGGTGLLLYKTIPPNDPPGTNPNNQQIHRLTAEPTGEMRGGVLVDLLSGRPATPKHWDLTPLAQEPSLLAAFNQFNYLKHAIDNPEDKIDDERIQATLEKAIEWDRAQREARGFPWRAPEGWSAEKVRDAQRRVSQYLRYLEAKAKWHNELQTRYRDAITPSQQSKEISPDVQREADLLTVIVLFLEEEIRALNEQIRQYGGVWLKPPMESGVASPSTLPAPEPSAPSPTPSATPETPPSAVPTSNELMARLKELVEMKNQGLLTEEEFREAKKKLLGL